MNAHNNKTHWWETATIYQIYPRSFNDSNDDGIGDLNGIRERIPYLKNLGIDAVWLSPFYKSPGADAGYDVSDYLSIDKAAGDFREFDALVSELHNNDLKIIIDIVPNHCSIEHELFLKALASAPGSAERELFHFRDGTGENGELPPNNWKSHFGGNAWTQITNPNGEPDQWYLHLFDPGQPDFNWDNPAVEQYFLDVLEFWLERGVDGFRVDVAHLLSKDPLLPNWDGPANGKQHPDFPTQDSPMFGRDEVHNIFRSWRELLDKYSSDTGTEKMMCGEVCVQPLSWQAQWARPDEMHTVFNFSLLEIGFDSEAWATTISNSLEAFNAVGAPTTWVLNNHDVARSTTRLGYSEGYPKPGDGVGPDDPQPDIEKGLRRACAAVSTLFALPGSVYIYQGEELGLPDHTTLSAQFRNDPTYFRTAGKRIGRDGCRIPLPWNSTEKNFGFSDADSTWLPQPAEFDTYSANLQERDQDSTLQLYKLLIKTRKNLNLGSSTLRMIDHNVSPRILAFTIGETTVVMNTDDRPINISELTQEKQLILASIPEALVNEHWLAAESTVWLSV